MKFETQKVTEILEDGTKINRVSTKSAKNKGLSTTELVAAVLSYRGGKIPNGQRLALVAIANHYNSRTGQCNPTWQTISHMTGLDRSTIHRAIHKANQEGILSWVALSYRGNNPHNSYCWQGLCPNAKRAWTGKRSSELDEAADYQIVSRSQGLTSEERLQSLEKFKETLAQFEKSGVANIKDANPRVAALLDKLGEEDGAAMMLYISKRKLSEGDALLELEKAVFYAPVMYERVESEGTPIQCLVADALDNNYKQLNWEWRVDHSAKDLKFETQGN